MTSSRLFVTAALVALLLTGPVAAESVTSQGVDIPRETEVDGERLTLFGHGVARYARIFRVYVAALYGPEDVAPEDLLDSNVPRRLEITYLRNVGADDIREATRVVLEDQYSESERDALMERFERFNALYEDVGDGDQYVYAYRPEGEESRLYLNGELQGTESGEDFARAYLGIWLRDDALSTSLRDELLFGKR
ncbi:chalcone isomerase family protein [Aquisalimonas sp.]|uniref:chalcone isomerase family protein n=1 Tax=unclassified Aquisalimonas TaxID=2644645 RepID=UPI0025C0BB49|nr:chalcone isomerase family protein [Aquisalimonas sp.]